MSDQPDQPGGEAPAPNGGETVAEAAAAQPAPVKTDLVECPCGKKPENLIIEMGQRAKFGRCMGDCCAEWGIEFRNGYSEDMEQTMKRAARAWNEAPRAA